MRDRDRRSVLARVPVSAVLVLLIVSASASVASAQLGGEVTFSGSGAGLLPSTTFTPASYEMQSAFVETWTFFDAAGTRLDFLWAPANGRISTVQVIQSALGWTVTEALGLPAEDVSLSGDTITFSGITLPQQNPPNGQVLILNGTLTRPDTTAVEATMWGTVKALFAYR